MDFGSASNYHRIGLCTCVMPSKFNCNFILFVFFFFKLHSLACVYFYHIHNHIHNHNNYYLILDIFHLVLGKINNERRSLQFQFITSGCIDVACADSNNRVLLTKVKSYFQRTRQMYMWSFQSFVISFSYHYVIHISMRK